MVPRVMPTGDGKCGSDVLLTRVLSGFIIPRERRQCQGCGEVLLQKKWERVSSTFPRRLSHFPIRHGLLWFLLYHGLRWFARVFFFFPQVADVLGKKVADI